MPALPIEVLSTAGIKHDGTNNNIDWTGWHWFADRYYGGWYCRVAEADLPADPNDIDSFKVTIMPSSTQASPAAGLLTVIADSDAWTASITPLSEWATTHGTQAWSTGGWTAGTGKETVDISAVAGAAIDASTNVGGYRYFSVIWKPNSTTGTAYVQVKSTGDAVEANRPSVAATYPAPANYETTLPVIDPAVTVDALLQDADIDCTGVSAQGGADGCSTYRKIDVYPARSGTKPAAGWPTVAYVHGGGWNTGSKSLGASENNTWRPMVEQLVDAGYNVVSMNYRLIPEAFVSGFETRSWPQNLHDVRAGLEWLNTNGAAKYDVDLDKVVLGGHSAGGHISLFAALSVLTEDSTTYVGKQNPSGGRPAGYSYSDSASPWNFDFDENSELSPALKPCGIILWDPPVSNWQLYNGASGGQKTINGASRENLLGHYVGAGVPGSTYDEADADHYIKGTGSTTFTGSAISASSIPPIFIITSTVEDIVPAAASITALEGALDAISYDTSTANGVLNTAGGLTQHTTAEPHADVIRDRSPWTEELAWLDEITGGTDVALSGAVTTGIAVAGALSVDRALSGAVSLAVVTAGSAVIDRALAGTAAVAIAAAGNVAVDRRLAGSTAIITSVGGALAVDRALSGSTLTTITISGALSVVSDRQLTGTVGISVATAGALRVDRSLDGMVGVGVGVSGALTVDRALSGAVTVATAVSGLLTVSGQSTISGIITVGVAMSGALSVDRALDGAVTVDTATSGAVAVDRPLAGSSTVTVAASGTLIVDRALTGTVTVTVATSGTVSTDLALFGTTTISIGVSGALAVDRPLSGAIEIGTATSGTITAPGDRPLSGAIAIAVIVAGTLTASAPPTTAWATTQRRPNLRRTDRRGVTTQ